MSQRSPLRALIGTSVFALAFVAPVSGQTRPTFKFLRQEEDWSRFEPAGEDFFDPIKNLDLSSDGDVWVSIGGRVESRYERWNDFGFGAAPNNDDGFTLTRLQLHADVWFGEDLRLFVEGKSAQSTDRDLPGGRRTLDLDTLALQNLFVESTLELEDSDLRVRFGRQSLLFGRQRLVSPLPWANTLRTWDGVVADHFSGPWQTTAFFTAFAPVDKTDFNERDDGQLLFGVYARRVEKGADHGVELYALGSTRENVTVNGTTGDSKRQTLGGRVWTALGPRGDAELEGAVQIGSVGGNDVKAGFTSVVFGYRPKNGLWRHRWYLGGDWASGDSEQGGDVRTFDQLFPLGHAYLGYTDFIGRQNNMSAQLGVEAWPAQGLLVRVQYLGFWLEDRADAIYNVGGGVLRAPGSFNSSRIGQSVDLYARKSFGRHLSSYAGFSHFIAGDALEDSGSSEDVDFAYLGLVYTF